jgi:hypothetical protein
LLQLGAFVLEESMPGRRTTRKGSFGGHFDELVTHFEDERREPQRSPKQREPGTKNGNMHDRLFESAWRKARDGQRPATNSLIEKTRSPAIGGS